MRTLATSLVLLSILVATSGAGAQQPAECGLLNDPATMALISGPGETSLSLRCGRILVPPPPAKRPAPAGADILVNNRATDTFPHVTQSETSVAVFNKLVLVGYNDSGQFFLTGDFTGYSRSTDGGATWTDMGPPTTPLGAVSAVFGDPVLMVDRPRAVLLGHKLGLGATRHTPNPRH